MFPPTSAVALIISILAMSQATAQAPGQPLGLNTTTSPIPPSNTTTVTTIVTLIVTTTADSNTSPSSPQPPHGHMHIAGDSATDSPPLPGPNAEPAVPTPSLPTHQPLQTQFLTQVPKGWPYSAFGMGRGEKTATWGLTDTEREGETVGVVRHAVLWFPRPVWTGREREREALAGWRSTFVVREGKGGKAGVTNGRARAVGAPIETQG